MLAVILPGFYHQVANSGINFAETVNVIPYRWAVEARRQYIKCCSINTEEYKKPIWDPLHNSIFIDEQEMIPMMNPISKKNNRLKRYLPEHRDISPVNDRSSSMVLKKKKFHKNFHVTESSKAENPEKAVKPLEHALPWKEPISTPLISSEQLIFEAKIERSKHFKNPVIPSFFSQHMIVESKEDRLDRLEKRVANNKKKSEAKRRYKLSNTCRPKTHQKLTPEKRRVKKSLEKVREKIRKYESILEEYNMSLQNQDANEMKAYKKLLKESKMYLSQILRRRDLEKALGKFFSVEAMKRRRLESYLTYEIARNFIDGRNEMERKAFINALQLINPNENEFWKNVCSSEESWNSCFGVDTKNFRVPAHNRL